MKGPDEAQKKWVRRMIQKWQKRLFLHEWVINVEYVEKLPDNASATCSSSATYSDAVIRIAPLFWEQPKDRWEHTIVHELCHCLTSRMSWMLTDFRNGNFYPEHIIEHATEQLTQRIANIVYQQEWKK